MIVLGSVDTPTHIVGGTHNCYSGERRGLHRACFPPAAKVLHPQGRHFH